MYPWDIAGSVCILICGTFFYWELVQAGVQTHHVHENLREGPAHSILVCAISSISVVETVASMDLCGQFYLMGQYGPLIILRPARPTPKIALRACSNYR